MCLRQGYWFVIFLMVCSGCSDASEERVDTGDESADAASEDAEDEAEEDGENRTDLCLQVVCDDGNECTDDSCDPLSGECVTDSVPGGQCDDDNACTTDDKCTDTGACVGASNLLCDDGEGCTDDLCDQEIGCVFEAKPDGETCNDGDNCTMVDACQDGECVGADKPCPEDDNPCTVPGGCDGKTGECLFLDVPDGTLCEDGNDCTDDDLCTAGECVGGAPTECFDNNPCTDDGCNPKGGCSFFLNQEFCDDGTLCTTNDQCLQGQCKGDVLECDDGNQCTNDGCDPETGCIHEPVDVPCEDGNPCTLNDNCEGSFCVSGDQKPCDDGNPCSDEYCALETGDCLYEYIDSPCNDGDVCTEDDACKNGSCKGGTLVDCNDGNQCTNDSCEAGVGCLNETIINKPCDDGNGCTTGDVCGEGTCAGTDTSAQDCDDGNVCTTDSCVESSGCVNPPNALSCDDGDVCTTGDTCAQTLCIGGAASICDDGNICTDDACAPETGCIYTPNGVACDDGNVCTLNDVCGIGACAGVEPLLCDDGNVCTDDICEADNGCVFNPNANPCDDGSACTTGDTCVQGLCSGGEAPNCEDGNPCTDDSCDSLLGCLNDANSEACDDGDVCTVGDSCASGACQSGSEADCDDGNACTVDSCDAITGCVATPDDSECASGDLCITDTCDVNVGCTSSVTPNCCGNGTTEEGEECDDGNDTIGDGCASDCTSEVYPADCVSILKNDPGSADGAYIIDPDGIGGNVPFDVWCDMEKGGWAMLLSANASGTYWGNGSPNWNDAGGDAATGYVDQETHQAAYSDLPTKAIRLCYLDNEHCFDFKHDLDMSLQDFFTQNITYTVFSTNTVGVSDTGVSTLLDAYSTDLGVALGSGDALGNDGIYCDWLGINLSSSTSSIGWLHDENAGCVTGLGSPAIMDDGAFGVGLNHCFDATDCAPGGPDNLNGSWRNAFGAGIDGWGESGPWFVLGRTTLCGDGATDPGENCDDGNLLSGDGCSSTCQVECDNLSCDDSNPCTTDTCDPTLGCVNTDNDDSCDDGDSCTLDDVCVAGSCAPGEDLDCDDGVSCTLDSCDPSAGCVNDPDDGICSTGQLCVTDTCSPIDGCVSEPTDGCCGNGIVEAGETCDGNCPTCYTNNPCTGLTLVGSASTCDAQCVPNPSPGCFGGDNCCPLGCSPSNDSDCNSQCKVQIDVICHNQPGSATPVSFQIKTLDPSFDSSGMAPAGYLSWSYNWPTWPLMPNWCLNNTGMQTSPFASACIQANYNNADCLPTDYSKSCQENFCYSCP